MDLAINELSMLKESCLAGRMCALDAHGGGCVQSFDAVMAAIGTHKAGQTVSLTFQRC